MVRAFQSVISAEIKEQIQHRTGRLPDLIIACIGGGSNAIGAFHHFIDESVTLIGVESGRQGHCHRPACGAVCGRHSWRAARLLHLRAAKCRRANSGHTFDFGRTRLSRHWPRTTRPSLRKGVSSTLLSPMTRR